MVVFCLEGFGASRRTLKLRIPRGPSVGLSIGLHVQSDFVNPCFLNPYASQSEHRSSEHLVHVQPWKHGYISLLDVA